MANLETNRSHRWISRILAMSSWLWLAFSLGCLAYHSGPMPGEPQGATFMQVGGVRVRYTDSGQGPPVVLIHGYASALETWSLLTPLLQPTHRVIALDLKGFGWSDRPEGDYSPTAQADLVFALLDRLGVERAAVVAHSWGCSVALTMALSRPERVSRLVLYDAWAYEDQVPMVFHWAGVPGLGELIFALFYGERTDEKLALAFYDPTFMTELLAEAGEAALDQPGTRAAALAVVRHRELDRLQDEYPAVHQPALLLWGREDPVSPLSFGERLARDLPRVRLVVYPRCGHFPMLEAAAASNQDAIEFLNEGGPATW